MEQCPAYRVEVRGNGDVRYEGVPGNVLIAGHYRDSIPRGGVRRLVASFRDADYFSLQDRYASLATDLPTAITSIAFDGHKKSVVDYGGLSGGDAVGGGVIGR